jgi:colanic acid/amylovoran biosynthesis glycosyltransferase
MRIAELVGTFPVLSQTFIVNQITGLLDDGHQVDIYAYGRRPEGPAHEDVDRYGLLQRTRYVRPPRRYVARLMKAPAILMTAGAWRVPGVPLGALNLLRHGRLAGSLDLLYGSAAFLRQKAAHDVLHCQFGHLARVALALRATGVAQGKLVVSFRGADLTKGDRATGYRQVFDRCDLVLPVCEAFARRLLALGCDARKIHVHHSGIRVARFSFAERRRAPGEPTRILTIARLVEKKGLSYAIEAVARLKASGRAVRYRIVGDGGLRPELERLVEDLGVRGEVQFLAPRSHAEVVPLLAEAHLLLAPSVTAADGEQEGIPNVLKEAMATGLPVVSTFHSGIPELVEDGRSGALVPERDAAALAERLGALIDRPECWPSMGRAGRARVEAEYDISGLTGRLIGLYQQIAPA